MKIRVADYITEYLADRGVTDCFTVTGGGAMHLNDSFGNSGRIRCTFNHHEQACAIAAESYARLTGRMAAVCVTSGPGGTNAITGVMGAWLDSIPMIVISGQIKRETTIHAAPELQLRQLGDQEFDIIHSVANMTKYAVQVTEPAEIAYHLEKAVALATSGRKGPAWIDVPLDVQGAVVETEELAHYSREAEHTGAQIRSIISADLAGETVPEISGADIDEVLERIREAKAPLILIGTGVRLAGAEELLLEALDRLRIPAVTAWNANDLLACDSPWFAGMPGTVGTRPGNFALQNCDLLLSLGCRMNIRMVGYTHFDFAKNAFRIAVDIDENELRKPTLKIDKPIHGDVKEFLRKLLDRLPDGAACSEQVGFSEQAALSGWAADNEAHERWLAWCKALLKKYPAVPAEEPAGEMDPYRFIDALFEQLEPEDCIVCGNGSACVVTFQAAKIRQGQRMYTNSGCASMGYGFPAAIGAAVARDAGTDAPEAMRADAAQTAVARTAAARTAAARRVICIDGDGSFMMNLQELATVAYNHLDVRIFLLNNNGYHSIRQTQKNLFRSRFTGIDPATGVGFPAFAKVAEAFEIPYFRIEGDGDCEEQIRLALAEKGPVICEVMIDPARDFAPKVSSRVLPDGRIVSPTLDDMAPFLSREEYEAARYRP